MLRFISLHNRKILSVQQIEGITYLVLESEALAVKHKMQRRLEHEAYTLCKGEQPPILCNYTQQLHNEHIVDVSLVRIASMQEAQLALQRKFFEDDSLL